jgi:hypothetical protein
MCDPPKCITSGFNDKPDAAVNALFLSYYMCILIIQP